MSTTTVNLSRTLHCDPGRLIGASQLYTLKPQTVPNNSLRTAFHKSYFLLNWACFGCNGETQMLEGTLRTLIKVLKNISSFDLETLKHIL